MLTTWLAQESLLGGLETLTVAAMSTRCRFLRLRSRNVAVTLWALIPSGFAEDLMRSCLRLAGAFDTGFGVRSVFGGSLLAKSLRNSRIEPGRTVGSGWSDRMIS